MSQSPRLEEVIAAGIQDRLEAFWTSIACVVVSYDATSQKAVVRPVTVASWIDGSGTEHDPDHPSLYDVPVVFPGGKSADGKAFRITFPISPGDGGVLVVSTLPTQGWSETGALQVVDLEVSQAGRNSLSCGYFVPGLGSKSVVTQAPTDALVVWGDLIKLGSKDATEKVATKRDLDNIIGALKDPTIVKAMSTYAAAVPPADTAALAALVLAVNNYFLANPVSGSSKVKADV